MNTLFIRLLNLSIAATWIIIAVILIRAFSKKAPKWFPCLLWALVGIRLLCPVTIQSPLSPVASDEVIPVHITSVEETEVDSEIPVIDHTPDTDHGNVNYETVIATSGNNVRESNPQMILQGSNAKTVSAAKSGVTTGQVITVASYVWIAGLAVMLGYAIVSYIRLKKTLVACIPLRKGVMASDEVRSPFILGVFRPIIYVPSSIGEDPLKHVIAHEESHLKRHDHWWKPLGFLILSVYWFHPLCWVAYILLCRDIEMACDEKVISEMKKEEAASYSQTLLDLSFRKTSIAACPVAFGEVGVKQRVKNVLNYKKPGFWVIIGLIVISAALSVLFLTKPMKKTEAGSDKETTASEEVTKASTEDTKASEEDAVGSDSAIVTDSTTTEETEDAAEPAVPEELPGSRVAYSDEPEWPYWDEMMGEAVNVNRLGLSHERSFPMYRFDTKEELEAF
ncbi:MAG: M56 family metallopeptidase, partial [Clostridiales bacterium]|nr:M56 family metallopeptidase [Clostridiales bacterium]